MITKNRAGGTLSAGFISNLQATTKDARIRFKYDSVDYSAYVLSVGQIQYDTRLTVGEAIVKVSNADLTWNIFFSLTSNMGKTASLDLYWDGGSEYMPLFTGTIEHVRLDAAIAYLHIRTRAAQMIEKRVGSGQNPVDYYSGASSPASPMNPADMVWDILVTYGGQDNTASAANTDIDYVSWSAWKTAITSWSVKGRFTGQSIRTALMQIAQLTTSIIFVDEAGKFNFVFGYTASEAFTNADYMPFITLSSSKVEIVNSYKGYFAYDPDPAIRAWNVTPYSTTDAVSIAAFGTREFVEEDRNVWHATEASATAGAAAILGNYAYPYEQAHISSPAFYHYRVQIGDSINVTDASLGLSGATFKVVEEIMDVDRGQVTHRAYKTGHV